MTSTAQRHLPWGGLCSTHNIYAMTCEDMDDLWRFADGKCQVCGVAGPETWRSVSCIDHDSTVGGWAVRGLLCDYCNSTINYRMEEPVVAAFLGNPWYLARFGALAEVSEPPMGWVAHTEKAGWKRETNGWRPLSARPQTVTWPELQYRFGPHIRLLPADDFGQLVQSLQRLRDRVKAGHLSDARQTLDESIRIGMTVKAISRHAGCDRNQIFRICRRLEVPLRREPSVA